MESSTTENTNSVYGASALKRSRRNRDQIAALDEAIVEAVAVDAPVSLRGVYYRCVSAGAVDKTEAGYRAVGRRLLRLRRERRVAYGDITDGTRWVAKPTTFDGWEAAIEDAAYSYRRALWSSSLWALQIHSEKEAIVGVVEPVTSRWDVALGIMRGYSSETFAWKVAASLDAERVNVIADLGDHDPSGVGAWENFAAKVAEMADPAVSVEFVRLAVTAEQIDEFQLPTRPTKKHDTRAKNWQGGSVEVDAIPASTLRAIVEDHITSYLDDRQVQHLAAVEAEERRFLRGLPAMLRSAS